MIQASAKLSRSRSLSPRSNDGGGQRRSFGRDSRRAGWCAFFILFCILFVFFLSFVCFAIFFCAALSLFCFVFYTLPFAANRGIARPLLNYDRNPRSKSKWHASVKSRHTQQFDSRIPPPRPFPAGLARVRPAVTEAAAGRGRARRQEGAGAAACRGLPASGTL